MGRFKKEKFRSKEGTNFFIFHPTIVKKGSVVIKGKSQTFVRKIKNENNK